MNLAKAGLALAGGAVVAGAGVLASKALQNKQQKLQQHKAVKQLTGHSEKESDNIIDVDVVPDKSLSSGTAQKALPPGKESTTKPRNIEEAKENLKSAAVQKKGKWWDRFKFKKKK